MLENKEITALFHLIDDPDEEVFNSVTDRIVSFGNAILPNLEDLWEKTPDENLQERIAQIIHKLQFRDLVEEFMAWKNGPADLLQGAMLLCKYAHPEANQITTLQEIEKMRRNIWLELNSYLTPLEQTNVISGILYSYYKIAGNEISYDISEDFLLTKLIENKRGNAISNGILYLILSEMLDIPTKAIQIPQQFILGYFDLEYKYPHPVVQQSEKISFFIDPLNGQVYSQKDVDNYFNRIESEPLASYYQPLDNIKIIQHLLIEYSKCYSADSAAYKKNDLLALAKLLSD